MQRQIKYKGIIIRSNIPSNVRKNTFQKFKSNYKGRLIANYLWTTAKDFGWNADVK